MLGDRSNYIPLAAGLHPDFDSKVELRGGQQTDANLLRLNASPYRAVPNFLTLPPFSNPQPSCSIWIPYNPKDTRFTCCEN